MIDIETKFGTITSIQVMGDPEKVQVIHFDREGSDHTHDRREHAVCLSGHCELIINGFPSKASFNMPYVIQPGVRHRMRPLTDEPSVWLIWYS